MYLLAKLKITAVGVAVFAGGIISDQNLILLLGLLIQILALLLEALKDRNKE